MLFIDLVSTAATISYRSLQGLVTTMSQQCHGLKKLSQLLINLVNASPLLEGAEVNEEMNVVSTNQTYSLALVDMIGTLNDLGTFAIEAIEGIGAQRIQPLCFNLSKCMVNLIEGIEAVTAERDSSNEATEEDLPPVLPHELVKLRGAKFAAIIRKQQERLQEWVLAVEANKIEQEFQELKLAYQTEESFKNVLDQCDHKTSFCKGWDIVHACFKQLENFCGGLATVFPGTANVESNFSILKWEKDNGRTALTHFSLEGIMHAKQYD